MNAVAEDGDMEAMRKHFEVAMKERTAAAALVLEPNILAAGEVRWCVAYRKGPHGLLTWFITMVVYDTSNYI